MSYILGQYNHKGGPDNDNSFAVYETVGEAKRLQKDNVDPLASNIMSFNDECLYVSSGFTLNNNYYFHGKIQRKSTKSQIFTIKLLTVEVEDPSSGLVKTILDSKEQYIKTITIGPGDIKEFIDIEFIFSPMDNFNCIVFELQRDTDDYRLATRYPKIIYEELSSINNIISGKMGLPTGTKFIKIGVQSRPGLMMCINSEEIRNSRTGIFEIKNGIMTVSFFSVINVAKENDSTVDDYIASLENVPENTEIQYSRCFFDNPKTRRIDSFTIDYMYQYKEE